MNVEDMTLWERSQSLGSNTVGFQGHQTLRIVKIVGSRGVVARGCGRCNGGPAVRDGFSVTRWRVTEVVGRATRYCECS